MKEDSEHVLDSLKRSVFRAAPRFKQSLLGNGTDCLCHDETSESEAALGRYYPDVGSNATLGGGQRANDD